MKDDYDNRSREAYIAERLTDRDEVAQAMFALPSATWRALGTCIISDDTEMQRLGRAAMIDALRAHFGMRFDARAGASKRLARERMIDSVEIASCTP